MVKPSNLERARSTLWIRGKTTIWIRAKHTFPYFCCSKYWDLGGSGLPLRPPPLRPPWSNSICYPEENHLHLPSRPCGIWWLDSFAHCASYPDEHSFPLYEIDLAFFVWLSQFLLINYWNRPRFQIFGSFLDLNSIVSLMNQFLDRPDRCIS